VRIVIISGLSGAGKSVALHTLEDHQFYCIDNLPLEFLGGFISAIAAGGVALGDHIAVSVDARSLRTPKAGFREALEQLAAAGIETDVLFIDADTETLLRRYNETRRPHPMAVHQPDRTLEEHIENEKELLNDILMSATMKIDTANLNQNQLKDLVSRHLCLGTTALSVLIQSFGYKNGVPANSDYVFDVRCLPNPYWQPGLRRYTGRDEPVIRFLDGDRRCGEMLDDLGRFLRAWLPQFSSDARSYLTVSVGCTGGRHRSVYVVEKLHRRLRDDMPAQRCSVTRQHRDLAGGPMDEPVDEPIDECAGGRAAVS